MELVRRKGFADCLGGYFALVKEEAVKNEIQNHRHKTKDVAETIRKEKRWMRKKAKKFSVAAKRVQAFFPFPTTSRH